ncbi:MAG TPA: PAS domain S-box protein, partial [Burkholderiales bacterium]|nr:PAS domain S-box protein [Burkholderiales bacterium]
ASDFERFSSTLARKEFQKFAGLVEFVWLEGLPMEDIEKRVAALSRGAVVILGNLVVDASGFAYDKDGALRRVYAAAKVPIFGFFESSLGKGIVGGVLYPDVTLGVEGARVAIRVLKGETPGAIKPVVLEEKAPAYDWRELQRFGISEDRLPPGSQILYRPETLWQAYRWHMAVALALVLLQAALISGLVLQATRRRRTEAARELAETELRHAVAALRESEERFRVVADTAPVMIWMTDADNLGIFFNKGWLAFTGRTLEQESGKGWAQAVHRDDLERCLQTCAGSFRMRQSFTMEFRLRRGDGEYRWVFDTGVPRFEHDGTFLGYTGSCIDITERRQTDERLRHERAFLRQVIDIDPNLIFVKDRESRFTLVNQATADLYGTTVEDLIGKTHSDLSSNVAEAEHFRRVDREVMDTLEQRFIPEEQITDAGGKVRWLQTVKRPIVDETGRASQLLGSATDITRRKETELELERQRNELAHLSRVAMLGEMSGSLAHELNQPLTAILTNAQAAQRFLAGDAVDLGELRDILEDIVSDDRRAGEIIHGLHQLLRKGEIRYEPVDLNEVVRDVIRLVRSDLVNGGTAVTTELAPQLPMVSGDRVQLQQVLINLVMNGSDAMTDADAAERQLVVRTLHEEGGRVRVTVVDNGRGIPPANMERVFEPFYTTKKNGLGLGLAVCRTIISSQGGHLWGANNTTRGASFHFTLRRTPQVEAE